MTKRTILALGLAAACGGCGGRDGSVDGEADAAADVDGGPMVDAAPPADGGASSDAGRAGCEPTTCGAEGAECGWIVDGCGGSLHCGACPDTETCGGAGPHQCGPASCEPTTCGAEAAECGSISDGCASMLDCGSCEDPGHCGAGGVPNQCCVPTTCEEAGAVCGPLDDGCGGTLECGSCAAPETCGAEGVPNRCGLECGAPRHEALRDATTELENARMSVGSDGAVHLAYVHRYPGAERGAIRYATDASGTWIHERADAREGSALGIVLDSGDAPHIIASHRRRDGGTELVHLARTSSGEWTRELLEVSPRTTRNHGEVAIDAAGNIHVAYIRVESTGRSKVRYGILDEEWVSHEVAEGDDDAIDYAFSVRLAVEASGAAHLVVARRAGRPTLVYLTRAPDSDAWVSQHSRGVGWSDPPGIALEPSTGKTWLAYHVRSRLHLVAVTPAVAGGRPMTEEPIEIDEDTGLGVDLTLDPTGAKHLAYRSGSQVRYATDRTGDWTISTTEDLPGQTPRRIHVGRDRRPVVLTSGGEGAALYHPCPVEPCVPACGAGECGRDGCGGVCGDGCGAPELCHGNTCRGCVADCSGRECGDDLCGGSCGTCGRYERCDGGECVVTCTPDCDGRTCGDDGCGGSCGSCGDGETCSGGNCRPCECGSRVCGFDECGRRCGSCPGTLRCADDGDRCCLPSGMRRCYTDGDCCSGLCYIGGCYDCLPTPSFCDADWECCSGHCDISGVCADA